MARKVWFAGWFLLCCGCASAARAAPEAVEDPTEGSLEVVVAVRDLAPGVQIVADDVQVRRLGAEQDREHTFARLADVLGRVPTGRILSNEAVREERLARVEVGVGLGAILTPGMIAVALTVDVEQGWSPLIQLLDRVDIYWTEAPPTEGPASGGPLAGFATGAVVQSVRVLAVDAHVTSAPQRSPGRRSKGVSRPYAESADPDSGELTLELTREEAVLLWQATLTGRLAVAVRSDIDPRPGPAPRLTLAALLAPAPPLGEL